MKKGTAIIVWTLSYTIIFLSMITAILRTIFHFTIGIIWEVSEDFYEAMVDKLDDELNKLSKKK